MSCSYIQGKILIPPNKINIKLKKIHKNKAMIGNLQTQQTLKKLVQVSEDVQQPVYAPFFLGGECFLITQQDVRKVEDIRLISYCKIMPNGQVIPMDSLCHDVQARDNIINAFQQQQQSIINNYGVNSTSLNMNQIIEFLNRLQSGNVGPAQNLQVRNSTVLPVNMDLDDQHVIKNVPSVEQHLQWSNVNNSSAVFPLHCSNGTSTSEIPQPCICNKQDKNYCTRGCNTSEDDTRKEGQVRFATTISQKTAREQLKERKKNSTTEFSYIS